MEVDDDVTSAAISRTSCIAPVLRTSPFIKKGRKSCIICFSCTMKKNAKQAHMQKKKTASSHIIREDYYGLSMNILTVKLQSSRLGEK